MTIAHYVALALPLFGQDLPAIDEPGRIMSTLQPTELAEFWVGNGGEFTRAPKRISPDRIGFQFAVAGEYIEVKAAGCRDGEPDFASCERFTLDGGGVRRHLDIRQGMTVAMIDQIVLATMLEIESR